MEQNGEPTTQIHTNMLNLFLTKMQKQPNGGRRVFSTNSARASNSIFIGKYMKLDLIPYIKINSKQIMDLSAKGGLGEECLDQKHDPLKKNNNN